MKVPLDYHRYIVGTRGQDIRSLADKYHVQIDVPRPELQEELISIYGTSQNCEEAKQVLESRVMELEAEKEERVSDKERERHIYNVRLTLHLEVGSDKYLQLNNKNWHWLLQLYFTYYNDPDIVSLYTSCSYY